MNLVLHISENSSRSTRWSSWSKVGRVTRSYGSSPAGRRINDAISAESSPCGPPPPAPIAPPWPAVVSLLSSADPNDGCAAAPSLLFPSSGLRNGRPSSAAGAALLLVFTFIFPSLTVFPPSSWTTRSPNTDGPSAAAPPVRCRFSGGVKTVSGLLCFADRPALPSILRLKLLPSRRSDKGATRCTKSEYSFFATSAWWSAVRLLPKGAPAVLLRPPGVAAAAAVVDRLLFVPASWATLAS
mmetsp:Transcript_28083/g.71171  ORF Transcript_28083/g.71171 Transcript_28083/m.71171 type:complete len:241 (-) Transcript_28083:5351-6073(-)